MVDKSKTFNLLKESLENLVEHYNKLTWNDLDVQFIKQERFETLKEINIIMNLIKKLENTNI